MSALQRLSVTNNMLRTLPPELGMLSTSLATLVLNGNTSLTSPPKEIQEEVCILHPSVPLRTPSVFPQCPAASRTTQRTTKGFPAHFLANFPSLPTTQGPTAILDYLRRMLDSSRKEAGYPPERECVCMCVCL